MILKRLVRYEKRNEKIHKTVGYVLVGIDSSDDNQFCYKKSFGDDKKKGIVLTFVVLKTRFRVNRMYDFP